MARTIAEIKRTMTDAFMANATLREAYGLAEGDTFERSFSAVSIESILFYIVAACCHVMEALFDRHRQEVDDKIGRAVVASVPWYYKIARQFQYGDALTFDETTSQWRYPAIDEKKRLVRYVAVRDRGTSIQVLASADKDGLPEPLSADVLTAFKHYMNRVKIAGVVLNVRSLPADSIQVRAMVQVDPLILSANGTRNGDGAKPVEAAINAYLRGITYGGTFNKTSLVDAIQAVEGVVDVTLGECLYKAASDADFRLVAGNNYTAEGGSLVAIGLQNSIRYVV
jgi:hypothetical protein